MKGSKNLMIRIVCGALLSGGVAFGPVCAASASPIDVVRISRSSSNVQGNAASDSPSVSADGNLVVFASLASNLVSGDSNGTSDIFLYNRASKTITRLSETLGQIQGNGSSIAPKISADGQFVAFLTDSTNLTSGDSNNTAGDGNYDLYLLNRGSGQFTIISRSTAGTLANGPTSDFAMSDDGRYVAFESTATNLVSGDSNGVADIFVRDTALNQTARVSVSDANIQGNARSGAPAISADGRYVVFESNADNLVSGDSNDVADIFRFDRTLEDIDRVSVSDSEIQGNGESSAATVSGDGNLVVFQSLATNLVADDNNTRSDIYVRSISAGTTSLLSTSAAAVIGNGASRQPVISSDGAYIFFLSDATNLVSGDSNNDPLDEVNDLFRKRLSDGAIERLNRTTLGTQVRGSVAAVAVDADASVAVYASDASSLVPGDSNNARDIFVTDTTCPSDSDGDTTIDCSDGCPFDANKIAAGVCGCGVADTDSDSDGTPNCNDACPTSVIKVAPGACGCDEADIDSNGNGSFDCFEPGSDVIPPAPRLTVRGRKIRVLIPSSYAGVTYEVVVFRGVQEIRSQRTTVLRAVVKGLSAGRYTARIRFITPSGPTELGPVRRFRIS